jgi:hypothetical protein
MLMLSIESELSRHPVPRRSNAVIAMKLMCLFIVSIPF